jgi:hypothetical protein
VKGRHPRRSTTIPVSRAGVHFNSVENAIDGDHWPFDDHDNINVAEIRHRIHAAGLD